jgi:glycosyltransferase involved in cell wall biosynthesis
VSDCQVSIALATHNGERYLAEQLASLDDQTAPPAELIVCDDASHDGTVELLEAFARESSFPVEIIRGHEQVGAGEAFMRAAHACRSPLVAFCDQDDVWLPEKLGRCTGALADRSVVLAVHSWAVVDDRLARIGAGGVGTSRTLSGLAAAKWGQAPGMAMVFRRDLLSLLDWRRRPCAHEAGRTLLHDEWIWGVARVAGSISLLDEELCLYRQHGGNAEGAPSRKLRVLASDTVSLGAGYYERRRVQAEQWSRLLEEAGDRVPASSRNEACSYRGLADRLGARVAVYQGGSRRTRAAALRRAARVGVYAGRSDGGFGLRAFARDAVMIAAGRRGV